MVAASLEFLIWWRMVYEGTRLCDTCGEPIRKGNKYLVTVIPREKRSLFSFLNDANPQIAATFTEDANGNVRLDICLDCKMGI